MAIDSKKYLFAFVITAVIFGTAIFISNYFSNKKINEVKAIEDRLALEILASETQFSLLEETQCKDISNTYLTQELGSLSERLAYTESNSGFDSAEVENLKRTYSLLEIKDYLLMKKITEKCGKKPAFILYFYSNYGDCKDCQKTGYVLTALHDKYADLRIYSFDYNLDVEAVKTLKTIYKIEDRLPALIINGDPYYGFRSLDELESTVPILERLKMESDKKAAASSTQATTTKR